MFVKKVEVTTHHHDELLDITHLVQIAVAESGITSGRVQLFVPHTTAAVTINENADPDVPRDILLGLQHISPVLSQYRHGEGNSHAHIKSSLIGCSEEVLVQDGALLLGTWQGIWFCEFDGPRSRRLIISVMQG